MGRPPCCDKLNVKRGLWTPEEDAKILAYVSDHGPGNWTSVPKKAGLRRCGKSCRLRYTNYLRPDLKHDNFTPQEEELIINLHAAIGSRWSLIAQQLPGRTDNDVKNHWNTKLKKKLCGMGIDPVTHKPISQILADYENIGGLPKPGTRMGTLNRDLKNAFMIKMEPQDGFANHSMMPIRIPSVEPFFESPFADNANNHPMELLAQFQAIQLASDKASNRAAQDHMQPLFFSEGSSSTSPCSSTILQMKSQPPVPHSQPSSIPKTPSSTFSWSEFLLEDPFLQPNQPQEQDLNVLSSTLSPSRQPQARFNNEEDKSSFQGATEMEYCRGYGYPITRAVSETNDAFGACSSSGSSFVETILDRDNEMSWDFPSLLEEPFY